MTFLDTFNSYWQIARKSSLFYPICFLIFSFLWMIHSIIPNILYHWIEIDYYQHGAFIPFLSGYVIYNNREKLLSIPLSRGWFWVPFLIVTLFVLTASLRTDVIQISGFVFVLAIIFSVGTLLGTRWMFNLLAPISFLWMGMPVWGNVIDQFTNPLQLISTQLTYKVLALIGLAPLKVSPTTLLVGHFLMDVGVPCSGLKTLLSVAAFTFFFIMVANLKWWANILMLALVIPLCLFTNSLRVTLIGIVGNQFGSQAGMSFHDYSGYIVLFICFYILFKVAGWLGWNQ